MRWLLSGLFEGGQNACRCTAAIGSKRLQQRHLREEYAVVNVGDLEKFDANSTVDVAALKEKRLVVGTFDGLRILGDGEG